MKPKKFHPVQFSDDPRFYRDEATSTAWHRCTQRTLYADTDRSDVVYHANYLRYFEFGRASLMRDTAYPYREVEENGYVYPIISQGIDYFRPLRYDDEMHVFTRPGDIDRVKLEFQYIIISSESGELICKGYTRHCALNKRGTPVAIDPMTVALWQSFPK